MIEAILTALIEYQATWPLESHSANASTSLHRFLILTINGTTQEFLLANSNFVTTQYLQAVEQEQDAEILLEIRDSEGLCLQITPLLPLSKIWEGQSQYLTAIDAILKREVMGGAAPNGWSPTSNVNDAEEVAGRFLTVGYESTVRRQGNTYYVAYGRTNPIPFCPFPTYPVAVSIAALHAITTLRNQVTPKSSEEVTELKLSWQKDPCWDIETTASFEAHAFDLLAYRLECEKQWKCDAEGRLKTYAAKLGIPDHLQLAQYIQSLESRIAQLEDKHLS
jgi:hypothetical protein